MQLPRLPRWFAPAAVSGVDESDLGRLNSVLLPIATFGSLAALWIGYKANAVGAVLLWSCACLAVGSLAGFLFGIPRSGTRTTGKDGDDVKATGAEQGQGRPNTNLEEISDWLTKIVVGLSLANLGTLRDYWQSVGQVAAASLCENPTQADKSAALALISFFSVMGFLGGYLYTRLFLQGAIQRANSSLYGDEVAKRLAGAGTDAKTVLGEPERPTDADKAAAAQLGKIAPVDQAAALAPVREQAMLYEEVRRSQSFSPERTRRMNSIAAAMRRLAVVAKPHLRVLAESNSPGERLAATMALQMDFDPSYIEWLADRLHLEPAFVGFQAASALLARMDVVGPPERQKIVSAVREAKAKGIQPEAVRDSLVERILAPIAATTTPEE